MARPFAKPFYDSPEWRRVREYCLMRDSYTCQICGKPAQEVHHKIHLNEHNIHDLSVALNPDNLVSLCRDCHFAQHKYDRCETDVLPKIFFDENGEAHAIPRGEKS